MTTALQQLLAELDAAPAGCLDDVRRWVRTLAMEMVQMQQAVEDNAQACQHERAHLSNARWNDALECDLHKRDRDLAIAERDAARTEVERMRGLLSRAIDERDQAYGHGVVVSDLEREIERLTKERDEALALAVRRDQYNRATESDRDGWADQCQTARTERDAFKAELSNVRTVVEHETVEAIAKWLYAESSRLVSNAHTREANDRNQRSSALANAADSLRAGTWKEPQP